MNTSYGTIPTSSSPSDLPLPSSSSSSRALIASRRPWREMAAPLSLPPRRSFSSALERITTNAAYFHVNYAIIVLFTLFLSLLWHPASLIVFITTMAAWLFLYFLRDDSIILCGYIVEERVVLAVLSIFTVCLLLMTHAAVFLVGIAVGIVMVLAHAVFRDTEELGFEASMVVV